MSVDRIDSYGEPVTGPRRRLRGCRCRVPCLGFRCGSSHHRGSRETPWCRGGDDYADAVLVEGWPPNTEPRVITESGALVERCDECWGRTERLQRAWRRELERVP